MPFATTLSLHKLQRREIMDTHVGKAVVLIQRAWRLRRHMKSWRQYRRKVIIVQSSWRGKRARRRCEKIRQAAALSDTVDQGDHGNDRMAKLPADWQTQLQDIITKSFLVWDPERTDELLRRLVAVKKSYKSPKKYPSRMKTFFQKLGSHGSKAT